MHWSWVCCLRCVQTDCLLLISKEWALKIGYLAWLLFGVALRFLSTFMFVSPFGLFYSCHDNQAISWLLHFIICDRRIKHSSNILVAYLFQHCTSFRIYCQLIIYYRYHTLRTTLLLLDFSLKYMYALEVVHISNVNLQTYIINVYLIHCTHRSIALIPVMLHSG